MVESIVLLLEEIFLQGRHADKAVERILKSQKKWGARDRRFVAEGTYEIVRWWRYLGALAGFDPTVTPMSRELIWQVWAAWCYQTYQELPDWEEVKAFDRAGFAERKNNITSVAVRESVPQWLYDFGREELGPEWDDVLTALNKPAEVFLRTNTLRISRAELIKKLQDENIEVTEVEGVESALKLKERKKLASSECFKLGFFEVQDAASQWVAPLLRVAPGMTVIDACAGGGGKSLHLAALMKNKGKIISMDIHTWKLEALQGRARRNAVGIIETRVISSPQSLPKLSRQADRLLLDVPCSGLGVLRRHPDTKWKLSLEEIHRLEELQAEILRTYSDMVKPGGMMVYATCSVMPGENHRQVESFLASPVGLGWKLVEQIHVFPHQQGFDGFYGALLERAR